MTESLPTEAPLSNADLTANWIKLMRLVASPLSQPRSASPEQSRALADFSVKHGQQLAAIEGLARSIHPTWNEELSNGQLTREKMFDLYQQAAEQLDHPVEG